MLCKWCGMESATRDQCSWCHRPLSASAPDAGPVETEPEPASRPQVTLRRAPAPAPGIPRSTETGAEAQAAPETPAPIMAGQPSPAPAAPWSGAPAPQHRPADGPIRKSARPGGNVPAPAMPPARYSRPAAAPAPHRHVPAPAILPVSQQNRAGGAMPKSPYADAPAQRAGTGRPLTDPPVAAGQARAAAPLETAPTAEPAGLAEGVSAPRTFASAAEIQNNAAVNAPGEQSKYYPGQVVDPRGSTHEPGGSRQPETQRKESDLQIEWEAPATSMTTLVVRYLFAFAGVTAIACLLAHAYSQSYVVILLVGLFISGLLLPVMNVVPKQRDDSDDVLWFLVLTIVFGPAIGLIIYGVIGLLKQSANPAMAGCFVVSILLELGIFLSAGPTMLLFGPPWVQHGFDLRALFINWSAFAALTGWASANVFHRFDE